MYMDINDQLNLLKKQKNWLFGEGIVFFLLGFVAIWAPFFSTLALDYCYGAVLLVGGMVQLVRAVKTWGIRGSLPAFLWSLVTIGAGVIMLINPIMGILALTIVLACFFIIEGFFKFALYYNHLNLDKSFWLVISALVSVVLGCMILFSLPSSAFWVPGLFLGIDLIFLGCLLMGFSKRLEKM
jgi:uncharacterized membrane protein HdeD (DUF308 family)